MCGRRKIEKEYPELAFWGDMDFEMVKRISQEVPRGLVVQFHNNGEPMLYSKLGETLDLFEHCIRTFDTNGKLLTEKANEVIGRMETIAVSVFQDDPESDAQYSTVLKFLEIKGDRKPNLIWRCLGDVDLKRYEDTGCIVATRILHSPDGSRDYTRKTTVPEIGICLDALHHLSINRKGEVSLCVRFDPKGDGIIGSLHEQSLEGIWTGSKRMERIDKLKMNQRDFEPCKSCEYWGIANS